MARLEGEPEEGAPVVRVELRAFQEADLPEFFRHESDPEAAWQAAFGPPAPSEFSEFVAAWHRRIGGSSPRFRTILVDGRVAGNISRFPLLGQPCVGYWVGREFWGRGIATTALRMFLEEDRERPLFARVAHDNAGSIRVLEKARFVRCGEEVSIAPARGGPVKELIYRLDAATP